MALIKCSECESKISSKASSCPKCGCPVKKQKTHIGTGKGFFIIIIAAFILIKIFSSSGNKSNKFISSTTEPLNNDSNKLPSSSKSEPSKTETLNNDSNKLPLSNISYKIINTNVVPGIKRSLEVRLEHKVSEAKLRELAYELKNLDPAYYKRTFICYLLPEMDSGKGAWATTHFNPDLEVCILGLSEDQEQKLSEKTASISSGKILGEWINEIMGLSHRITIYQKEGRFYMEKLFEDGSSGTYRLLEMQPSSIGRRFKEDEKDDFGDHFIIDKKGDLQFWDNQGYISTAKRKR